MLVCDLRYYLSKISWISIELFAKHIVKMLLKHCMKFIAAEITELVKITKQEIVALVTAKNEMLLFNLLTELRLDSTVVFTYVQNTNFQVS